jgi:hypothetical protein
MNKPIHIEGRGKKKDRRQNNNTPDQELKDMIQGSNAEVAERAGISEEAAAEGRATIVNAAPGYKLGGQPFVPMGADPATYQGPGEDINKDVSSNQSSDPIIAGLTALPEGASPAEIAEVMLGNVTPEDGAILREQYEEVNGITSDRPSPPIVASIDMHAGNLPPLQGFHPAGNTAFLGLLSQAYDVVAKGLPDDMDTYRHHLLFKLAGVQFQKNPGSYADFVTNTPYYSRNLVLFVRRLPKSIPGVSPEMIKRTLELHPREIDGLERGFELKSRDMNNKQQRFVPNDSKVSMAFGEKYGRPIGEMFEAWGLQVAQVGVNDNTTIEFMLVEPDATHTAVQDAWLCSDMFPGVVDTDGAKRDLASKRDPGSVGVRWYGHVVRGQEIRQQALELLTAFNAQGEIILAGQQ